jgi:hypothetical protein
MKLTLSIDKSSAEDCPWDCPFNPGEDVRECILFRSNFSGYDTYKDEFVACDKCQEMYRKQQGEQG